MLHTLIKILNRYKLILMHIAAWLVYCLFILTTNRITNPQLKLIVLLPYMLPYCIAFYSSLFSLHVFKRKGVIYGIFSFLFFFLIIGTTAYYYLHFLVPTTKIRLYNSEDFKNFLRNAIIGYVGFTAYALLYFLVQQSFRKEHQLKILQEEKHSLEQDKIQNELENALLKQQELHAQQEKLQYEYAFLRAQINPHFLYNTLNVLFSQALPYSQSLADNIMKLSNIMRYSLESVEYESGKVSIQKELEHLQTLIEIHNIRFSNSMAVQYFVSGKIDGQMLPPLSMITIVENAFKYGDLKDAGNPLQIRVLLQPKQVYFYCRNKKKKNNIEIVSNNIGITNLSRRLDVAFKNKYDMKATNDEDFYTFELTIDN